MPISDAAIKKLTLGKDAEQVITDCMQDWQGALEWALDHHPDPPEDASMLDWAIGLVGNLLWACTVFFPPAIAIADVAVVTSKTGRLWSASQTIAYKVETGVVMSGASAATKAASVLGAAVGSSGSQIGGVLRTIRGKLDRPEAKKFFHEFFLRHIGEATEAFVGKVDAWAQVNLLNHIISQFSLKAHPNVKDDNDEAFTNFYNSAVGSHELRRYTWEQFVFRTPETTFDKQKGGLEDYLAGIIDDMIKDYETQFAAFERGQRKVQGQGAGSFADLIVFQPKFRFSGMPQELYDLHETNQKKLAGAVYGAG